MNHIFKIIFNRSLRTCVVCAEICKSHTRSKILKAAVTLAISTLLAHGTAWARQAPQHNEGFNNGIDNYIGQAWGDNTRSYYGIFWYENNSIRDNSLDGIYTWTAADSLPNEDGTEDTKRGIAVLNNIQEIDEQGNPRKKMRAYGGKAVSTVNSQQVKDILSSSSSDWSLIRTSGKAITNDNRLYLNGTNKLASIRGGGKLYSSRRSIET